MQLAVDQHSQLVAMDKAVIFSIFLLTSAFTLPADDNNEVGKVKVFRQKLDHISGDPGEFDMQYTAFDEYYKPGGPLFISISWLPGRGMYGTIFEDLAVEFKGYYVETDIRLYQNNFDFDLKYVTTDQVLDDLAYFIQQLKATVPGLQSSKVIVIGRYDRGTLAPWLRQKHPEVCDVAWATEAQMEQRATVDTYFESVGEMIKRHGSDQCYDRIHTAFESLKTKFANKDVSSLTAQFQLCDAIKTPDDQKAFLTSIIALFSEFPRWSSRSVKAACEKMTDSKTDVLAAFAEVMKQFRVKSPFSNCLPGTYEKLMDHYKNAGKYEFHIMCNEIGGFKTTTSAKQPFSANLDGNWYAKMCSDTFNKQILLSDIVKKVDDFNKRYGGKIPTITNAFYSVGEYSPFKSQAITQDFSDSVLAFVNPGEERAFVFQSLTADGVSDSLRQGQLRAVGLIRKVV